MKIRIDLTEEDLKAMVQNHVRKALNLVPGDHSDFKIVIEVKTSKNWKAEWEQGQFRAYYEGDT